MSTTINLLVLFVCSFSFQYCLRLSYNHVCMTKILRCMTLWIRMSINIRYILKLLPFKNCNVCFQESRTTLFSYWESQSRLSCSIKNCTFYIFTSYCQSSNCSTSIREFGKSYSFTVNLFYFFIVMIYVINRHSDLLKIVL